MPNFASDILVNVVRTKIPLISISFLSLVLIFVLVLVLSTIIQNVFVIVFVAVDEKSLVIAEPDNAATSIVFLCTDSGNKQTFC